MDIAVSSRVDPKKADQAIRGTVVLPHGIGRAVRVLVMTRPPKDAEALAAGADYAGLQEYVEKIQGGWAEIDVIIASPDVMGEVGKLGKVLGPRGLMPNPKSGTVTADVAKAVIEVKAGKIEFRVDKTGIVHASVGKADFDAPKLVENITRFLDTIIKAKPSSSKGQYVRASRLVHHGARRSGGQVGARGALTRILHSIYALNTTHGFLSAGSGASGNQVHENRGNHESI